jgi:hypothetical protein
MLAKHEEGRTAEDEAIASVLGAETVGKLHDVEDGALDVMFQRAMALNRRDYERKVLGIVPPPDQKPDPQPTARPATLSSSSAGLAGPEALPADGPALVHRETLGDGFPKPGPDGAYHNVTFAQILELMRAGKLARNTKPDRRTW